MRHQLTTGALLMMHLHAHEWAICDKVAERSAGCEFAVLDVGDLTPETFQRDYEGKFPILIRGATSTWPAHRLWSQEYLSQKFGQFQFSIEKPGEPACGPPEQEISMTLKDFLQQKQRRCHPNDKVVAPRCLHISSMIISFNHNS